jgi:hypothetical protein
MKYNKPNFKDEWMEALRYREFEKMGYEGWLDVAQNNFEIANFKSIEDVLSNINLDYDSLEEDKKKRFEEAFENGVVEIPMAVKFSKNDYDLLGGNTRLAGLIKNGINPKIWVVDLSKTYNYSKKIETKEMDSGSSGSSEGPLFGGTVKRKLNEDGIGSSGEFDVPFLGKSPKGRKNPLKVGGPETIYKNRAVKDKKWPRFGGPKAVYVKVKDKCKKFPYCNQGIGALEFIHEDKELQEAIKETSKKYGIPYSDMENIVLNEINKIFI